MKYTISKKVDKIVEKHLQIIKNIILKEIKPISIINFGGFGKGEGAIYKNKPFNDYDLYIITNKKISDEKLEKLGIKAAKEINTGGLEFREFYNQTYDANKFFHVDIHAIQYKNLSKLMKTTRTFELKHASQIIYGKDIKDKIKIKENEIPLSEGIRHFINKSAILLLFMDKRRFNKKFKKDEAAMIIYQSTKAIMGCCEALLLSKKRDAPTYSGRNKLFQKLYKKELPELAKKIDFATKLKLNFNPDKKDPIKYWKEARDCMYLTLNYLAKKHFNINSKNKIDLMRKLYKKLPYYYFNSYLPSKILFPLQYGLNILYFKRTKYIPSILSWRDIGIRLLMPCFLLLYAIEDNSLLKESEKYLKFIAPIKGNNWEGLRKSALNAYSAYFSRKLI